MLHGARWNSPGRRVIYASETYAGALLEILVHASGSVPRNQATSKLKFQETCPSKSSIRMPCPSGIQIPSIRRAGSAINGTTRGTPLYCSPPRLSLWSNGIY